MSEPLADYITGDVPRAVHCPHCGEVIGWSIIWRYPRPDGSIEVAQVFRPCDMVSPDLHGWYCLHCGERYHAGKRATKAAQEGELMMVVDNSDTCR